MTILIVDDSATMRMLLKRELRLAGWDDVQEASDAPSALEAVASSDVSLVLSDWHMPTMSGLELLRRLRGHSDTTQLGFITCEADQDQRAHALRAGAKFLITKPVDHEALDRHVRLALGMEIDEHPGALHAGERTLQDVLSRLFQRPVSVTPSPAPRRELPRGVAEYLPQSAGSDVARAVVEMPLAAAFGCALARIPAQEASEWASAHTLTGPVESNFLEVANVLAGLVSPTTGHYVLNGIGYVGERGAVDRGKEAAGWKDCVHVDISGYPAGRLGVLT